MNETEYELFFNQIYAEYHRAIYAYILGRVNNKEVAKDLLQDTFLRAWHHIHVGYELGMQQSRYWLFKMTKNLIIDYYRRKATRNHVVDKLKLESVFKQHHDPSPEETYDITNHLRRVDEVIQQLPEQLRSVLIMYVVGNMNSSEIGEWLDIPAGTVRYRLSMARKRLMNNKMLQDDLEMGGGR